MAILQKRAPHQTMSYGLRGRIHYCKNVSDRISKTYDGSKKKDERTVPRECVHIPPHIEPDCICYSSVYCLTTLRISLKSEFYAILEFNRGGMTRQSKHTTSQHIFPGLKRSSVTTVGMIRKELGLIQQLDRILADDSCKKYRRGSR